MKAQNMNDKKTKHIVIYAMLTAFCCIATLFRGIPSPTGGFANLGDIAVLLISWLLPSGFCVFCASLGSALADVLSGCAYYAPGTLVIKGTMALIAFLMMRRSKNKSVSAIVSAAAAEAVMIIGYFGYSVLLLGKALAAALDSVPHNAVQALVCSVVAVILYKVINRYDVLKRFFDQ